MTKKINQRTIYESSDGSKTLYWKQFDETYHSVHGALTESNHVFIKSGLDYFIETSKKTSLSILEMGFGTGLNAILTYIYANNNKLKSIQYDSLEAFPLQKNEYELLNYSSLLNIDYSTFLTFHECKWNHPHHISTNFELTKWNTTIQEFQPTKKFDIVYYDAFAPSAQPELWTKEIFEFLFHNMQNKSILVTYCAKGQVKRDLKAVGFQVEAIPGPPRKREITRAIKL